MKILIRRVATLDISLYEDKIKDHFSIDKIEIEDEIYRDGTYTKYYIDICTMEDLIELREILDRDIVLKDSSYTPSFIDIEEDVLVIYDDFLE